MNRTELYREKRKGIAKIEYMIFERLNELSDRIDECVKRIDDLSEHLYYYAKTDSEELKMAFDEMMGNPIQELEEIFKL